MWGSQAESAQGYLSLSNECSHPPPSRAWHLLLQATLGLPCTWEETAEQRGTVSDPQNTQTEKGAGAWGS